MQEPAYKLDAYWINDESKESAIRQGYTVVDPVTIITTHIGRMIKEQASELFGYNEAQQWLEQLRQESARLCDELVPDKLSLGQLMEVCRKLLRDQVPLSDRKTIATSLLSNAVQPQIDIIHLVEQARIALRHQILAPLIIRNKPDDSRLIKVFTLSSDLEKIMLQSLEQVKQIGEFSEDNFPVEPGLSARIQKSLPVVAERSNSLNVPAALLVTPQLRPVLARFARLSGEREITVLSLREIPDDDRVEIIGQLGAERSS